MCSFKGKREADDVAILGLIYPTLDEALALQAYHVDSARLIAGGSELLIEMDRGQCHALKSSELERNFDE